MSVKTAIFDSITPRHQTPDTRHQTPDTRHQTPDTRHQTPDTRHQNYEADRNFVNYLLDDISLFYQKTLNLVLVSIKGTPFASLLVATFFVSVLVVCCGNPLVKKITDPLFKVTYNLGDTGPGGGKIFYVKPAGFTMTDNGQICHYLEAAPSDMPTTLSWASSTATNVPGIATAIGSGRNNTALIVAAYPGDTVSNNAAKACDALTNAETDWFLPSTLELYELWVNRTIVGGLNGSGEYWSSCQWSSSPAIFGLTVRFSDGNMSSNRIKTETWCVRAIRAF